MISTITMGVVLVAIVLVGLIFAEIGTSIVEYWAVEEGWSWLWSARGVSYGLIASISWFVFTYLLLGQGSLLVALSVSPVLLVAFHWVDEKSYHELRECRIRYGPVEWVDYAIDDEVRTGEGL